MSSLTSTIDFKNPIPRMKNTTEAIQVEHEKQPMVLLKDQEGVSKEDMVISLPAFMIALMCDGNTTIDTVRTEISKKVGSPIAENEIKALLNKLDENFLLETPRLEERRKQVWDEYMKNPKRPATMIGRGYPGDKLELATFLGKYFKDTKGPGKELVGTPQHKKPPLGLLSPHIDLHRGGPAYAWTYQALSDFPPPDVVIALGVAHMSPNSPWTLTQKEYETPYGPVKVHDELYKEFESRLWYKIEEDQWVHRNEHSLEFQALWLKYLWKDKTPPWVPILCSSFERFCTDQAPSSIPTIQDALHSLGQALINYQKAGKTVMILGGVDLAHVGPRFGDNKKLDSALRQKIEEEDRVSLEKAMHGDADGFYMSVVADDHWRKVCGLSAIYTAARFIKDLSGDKAVKGKVLTYDQADDPLGGVVSFVGAIYD